MFIYRDMQQDINNLRIQLQFANERVRLNRKEIHQMEEKMNLTENEKRAFNEHLKVFSNINFILYCSIFIDYY